MILVVALIFVASLIASMFGLGGGILYTPFQLWAGIDFHEAVSTSLFLILFTSLSATIVYRHNKKVDWLLAIVIEVPTTTGAFVGGFLSEYIPVHYLKYLLVFLIFVAAALMLYHPAEGTGGGCFKNSMERRSPVWFRRDFEEGTVYINLVCVFTIMFFIGAIISSVGISGGILKVPLMTSLFGIPMPIAVGSSSFMVGLTALGGLVGHSIHSHINWRNVLILLVPVIIGAQIGSRISLRVNEEHLKKGYSLFLVIIGIITIFR